MTLSDGELLARGPALIQPFDRRRVQPASYDLVLHEELQVPSLEGYLTAVDLRKHNPRDLLKPVRIQGSFELPPGGCVLGSTQETVTCPGDLVARVEGKSSLGRLFLAVHITAGWIDSGFTGQITLEIVNHGPWVVVLWPGMPIAQINFAKLSQPCLIPYGSPTLGSHYQGQKGPTPAAGKRNESSNEVQERVESTLDR
jgi:dCTP deaminase